MEHLDYTAGYRTVDDFEFITLVRTHRTPWVHRQQTSKPLMRIQMPSHRIGSPLLKLCRNLEITVTLSKSLTAIDGWT